jgi:hypothetical protein
MEFQVYVVLEHVSGPALDQETVLDAFCAAIGRDNGAKDPMRVVTNADFDSDESTYVVKLVDDRKPV